VMDRSDEGRKGGIRSVHVVALYGDDDREAKRMGKGPEQLPCFPGSFCGACPARSFSASVRLG
jgi:hypothetical protein